MAISLGKLTILVGAGILGSVLAEEGRISKVSDFFSGAFKVAFKHIKQDDSPNKKPKSDTLLAQVDSLRQELQILASSRSSGVVTIISGRGSGAKSLAVPVLVIGVVGYGYIWWKGWKVSDLMFATRHSLSEASKAIAAQLEQVYSALSDTKKQLSSRINRVDTSLDECKEISAATRDEVFQLQGDLKGFTFDVASVQRAVQTLETKIGRIEEKQDVTNQGIYKLYGFAKRLEQRKEAERIQASPSSSSKPAIEPPQPIFRTASLPPAVPASEPVSPSSSDQSQKILRPTQSLASASGLKKLQGISDIIKEEDEFSDGIHDAAEPNSSSSSNSSQSGWRLPRLSASLLTRTRSATYSKQHS